MKPTRLLPIIPWFIMTALLLTPSSAHAGHTHSFLWLDEPAEKTLEHCIAEMELILRSAHHLVAGPLGHSEPIVERLHLEFNGIGAAAEEAFAFPGPTPENIPGQTPGSDCETARKPYDKIVLAALLVARDHFPPEVLRLSSDGDPYYGDWDRGVDLYRQALRREPPPFSTLFADSAREALAEEEAYYEDEYYDEGDDGESSWLRVLLTWALILLIVGLWILFIRRSGLFKKNQKEQLGRQKAYMERAFAFMDAMEERMERLAAVLERLEERRGAEDSRE